MKKFILDSFGPIDGAVWALVALFFTSSALLFGGDFQAAFIAAGGIILVMALIGLSIEVIIETLRHMRGLGTITGFITNGPEAVVLVVGLIMGDVLFAASTPLGSNLVNPVMLFVAAGLTGTLAVTFRYKWKYSVTCLVVTAVIALSFYRTPEEYFMLWLVLTAAVATILFIIRPSEDENGEDEEIAAVFPRWVTIPAILLMVTAGYFLDPVVEFAAESSKAPKGVIGFLVLATLTSWPEFKSCLALLRRKKVGAAAVNIFVSNITNLWLAAAGVATYLLLR